MTKLQKAKIKYADAALRYNEATQVTKEAEQELDSAAADLFAILESTDEL
jgi:hypothetical protein